MYKRQVEENLALFERMKNGEFAEGTLSLRAKIDMASPFMVCLLYTSIDTLNEIFQIEIEIFDTIV